MRKAVTISFLVALSEVGISYNWSNLQPGMQAIYLKKTIISNFQICYNDLGVIEMTIKSIVGFLTLVKKNLQTHMALFRLENI